MRDKVLIIAEAGINHNGEVGLAMQMIDAAKTAGVDCVKFQTFKPEEFITDPAVTWTYKSRGQEVTESQLQMFQRVTFTSDEWQEIIDYCKKRSVLFSTTAQNPSDLDLILELTDLPFLKVGSDDLTNLPLLRNYAKRGKPMIVSAGMAYEEEIADAVRTIREAGCNDLTVLHCVSLYPTEAHEVNLRKISAIREKFGVKVGFSDHTVGNAAAIGAVALGAEVIEKHFTLSHDLPGPDHWFSIDNDELVSYVADIRTAERQKEQGEDISVDEELFGSPELKPTEREMRVRDECRRSIVATRKIRKGESIREEDLEFKRPGTGISPRFTDKVMGRKASRDYQKGELIQEKV